MLCKWASWRERVIRASECGIPTEVISDGFRRSRLPDAVWYGISDDVELLFACIGRRGMSLLEGRRLKIDLSDMAGLAGGNQMNKTCGAEISELRKRTRDPHV